MSLLAPRALLVVLALTGCQGIAGIDDLPGPPDDTAANPNANSAEAPPDDSHPVGTPTVPPASGAAHDAGAPPPTTVDAEAPDAIATYDAGADSDPDAQSTSSGGSSYGGYGGYHHHGW